MRYRVWEQEELGEGEGEGGFLLWMRSFSDGVILEGV